MKRVLPFILFLFIVTLCFSMVSCNGSGTEDEPDVSGITFEDCTFVYDGSEKTIEISGPVPDGVSVQYTDNKKTDAGIYTATARLYDGSGKQLKELTATLTINKAVYDMSGVSLPDVTYTYSGSQFTPYIEGALPSGVTVRYNVSGQIQNAGSYVVRAIFTGNPNYENIPDMTATYTVTKATYDMSGVSFPDASITYRGEEIIPGLQGTLPEGVSVEFVSNPGVIEKAGVYEVTASFSGDSENYEAIPNMTATYTITKATYDMSGVSFPDASITYRGEEILPEIRGTLPEGVSVEFVSDPGVIKEMGRYTVTAHFTGDSENYEAIPDMTATYIISQIGHDTLGVSLPDRSFLYTGEVIEPALTGTLPDGITATVTSDPAEIKNVGVYTVTAKFYFNGEYGSIPDMTATYTVTKAAYDMSGVSFPDASITYTGEEITPEIQGTLPEGVSVIFVSVPGIIKEAGVYTVTASFSGDSENYEAIPDMTATYTVRLPQYVSGSLSFELLAAGTYEVTGYTGTITELAIPDKYLGKSVSSVRSNAFEGNTDLTYVFIPDSVLNIGNKAFKGCENLNTVIMSKAVKVIGAEAFADTALTEILLPDSLESLGRSSFADTPMQSMTLPFVGGSRNTSNPFIGYLFGALSYSGNAEKVPGTLISVTITGSAKAVPAYSFYGVESLVSVTVESGIVSIGNSAFSGCTSLSEVYIAATVTEIEANANVFNSPFYNTSDALMLVLEATGAEGFGRYWRSISDSAYALAVYGKSYEDYLMNKDDYRNLDRTVATLDGIFVDGTAIDFFAPDKLDYTVNIDINAGYPTVTATATSPISGMTIVKPTAQNSGVASIVVTSADGMTVKTYTVKVNFTGRFDGVSAEVVGKDGTTGTVTFVVDDGNRETAVFTTEMMDKYDKLKFTYAIPISQLATLKVSYDSASGKYYYVMSDGKYTYTVNQDAVDFWNNILAKYDTEVVSHTYSHAFWGNNDDGGVQKYVASDGTVLTSGNLPVGSATAQIYASKQIIEELLGIRAATHVIPGIGVATVDKVVDGVKYETYFTYYQELLRAAIKSGDILALAGNVMWASSAANRYVTKDNIKSLGVNGVARLMVTPTDNTDLWKQFIDNAEANNGWASFCIHKISETATSGHYILEKDAENLFAYAAAKNVWIANNTEAFLYYTEWASARVSAVYNDGVIDVSLTDEEDNAKFDEALTVKVAVPASWAAAEANGEVLEVCTDDDGSFYVLVDIVPDSGTVSVSEKI